jgi:hypothetical protein
MNRSSLKKLETSAYNNGRMQEVSRFLHFFNTLRCPEEISSRALARIADFADDEINDISLQGASAPERKEP